MSEVNHPPINSEFQEQPSFEAAFAGKMLTLLAAYSVTARENQGEYHVTYPVTDRVDIMGSEDHISGTLRLRRVRSMAFAHSEQPLDTSPGATLTLAQPAEEEFTVLALEYGAPKQLSHETVLDDDEFNWAAYVLAIASYETGETTLLDGRTGKELSGADLVEASYRLDFFATQISKLSYELFVNNDGEDGALDITANPLPIGKYRTLENMFHDFDQETVQVELYEAHECSPTCNILVHQQTMSN